MKYLSIFIRAMLTVVNAKPKFIDRQISAMIPRYFIRNLSAPKLIKVKIFPESGQRIYPVEIISNCTRSNDELGFTFSALATIHPIYATGFSMRIGTEIVSTSGVSDNQELGSLYV